MRGSKPGPIIIIIIIIIIMTIFSISEPFWATTVTDGQQTTTPRGERGDRGRPPKTNNNKAQTMVQPQGAPQSSSEATEPAAGEGPPPPHQGASGYPARGCAHRLKYVVIGDSGSGKTALVRRFSKDVFQESQDCTIGVDLVVKTLVLPNGDEVNLQVGCGLDGGGGGGGA